MPTVSTLTTGSGPTTGGTPVTIHGTGFIDLPEVRFNDVLATDIVFVSDTKLTCKTPAGAAGLAVVKVINPDGQLGFDSVFTYLAPPTVTGVNSPSGQAAGGTPVTITGTGFLDRPDVTFDGNLATNIQFISETTLTCDTPAGDGGPADVVVINPDGQSSAPATVYTYVARPTVLSVNSPSGPASGGTRVTINGSGFIDPPSSVTFNGTPATLLQWNSDTSIDCTTPAGSGPADVEVVNPDTQSGVGIGVFSYVPPPTVTSVTPITP